MKAVRTHGRGGPEKLFFEDAPAPVLRPGDVLVRVRATGITPAELTWDETYHNADGTPRIPSIPGHEPSGVERKRHPMSRIFGRLTRYMAWLIFHGTGRPPSSRQCVRRTSR